MRERDLTTLLRELQAEDATEVTIEPIAAAVSAAPAVARRHTRDGRSWRAARSAGVELRLTPTEARKLKDAGAWEARTAAQLRRSEPSRRPQEARREVTEQMDEGLARRPEEEGEPILVAIDLGFEGEPGDR